MAIRDRSGCLCQGGDLLVLEALRGAFRCRLVSAGRLLVGCGVEGEKEEKIGGQDAHASERGKLLTSALAGVGHPLEVGRGKVGIRREIDED